MKKQEKVKFIQSMLKEQMDRLRKEVHPDDLPKKEQNFNRLFNSPEDYISDIESEMFGLLNE